MDNNLFQNLNDDSQSEDDKPKSRSGRGVNKHESESLGSPSPAISTQNKVENSSKNKKQQQCYCRLISSIHTKSKKIAKFSKFYIGYFLSQTKFIVLRFMFNLIFFKFVFEITKFYICSAWKKEQNCRGRKGEQLSSEAEYICSNT